MWGFCNTLYFPCTFELFVKFVLSSSQLFLKFFRYFSSLRGTRWSTVPSSGQPAAGGEWLEALIGTWWQCIFSHLTSKKFYVRNGANSISYFATNLERDFVLSLFYKLWSFFAWKWWWSSRDKLYKCSEIIGISVTLLNVKLWLIMQMWKSNKCIWLFPTF